MPPLKERKEKKLKDLKKVENIEINIDSSMDNPELNDLPDLLSLMSTYIAEIWKTQMGHHNLLQRLIKLALNNPNCKSGYNFGVNWWKHSFTLVQNGFKNVS